MKQHKAVKITVLIIAIAVAAVFVGMLAYSKGVYKNRWYKNTVINGVDVSGKTLQESKKLILDKIGHYSLKVEGRDGGEMTIDGDDIDYEISFDKSFRNVFKKQHRSLTLPFMHYSYGAVGEASYDRDEVEDLLNDSELVQGSSSYKITKPQDAKIVYSEKKNQFVIKKEEKGNTLNVSKTMQALCKALDASQTTLNLSNESKYPDVYQQPDVTSDDSELNDEIPLYNNAGIRFLKWKIHGNVTVTVGPDEISDWLEYSDGKVTYDKDKLEDCIEKICLKYKTVGSNRTIKSHTGEKITIVGGDYGWQIDYEKMVEQAEKAMDQKIDQDLTEAYEQDPSAANKKKLTIENKVSFLNTAYKFNTKNKTKDYDPDNYTEIDLGEQKVYIFRNGKVKYTFRCISGKPVEGRKTPTGAYYIKEHQSHRVLKGDNYETPVDYWVRITWTGTGFHAAPWQAWSSWSSTYYISHGSHGCLNLSVSDAAQVYKIVKYREAVFIHD